MRYEKMLRKHFGIEDRAKYTTLELDSLQNSFGSKKRFGKIVGESLFLFTVGGTKKGQDLGLNDIFRALIRAENLKAELRMGGEQGNLEHIGFDLSRCSEVVAETIIKKAIEKTNGHVQSSTAKRTTHAKDKAVSSEQSPPENEDGAYTSQLRQSASKADEEGYFEPNDVEDERERKLREIVQRRGQPGFRNKLIAAYNGPCAVTGCDAVSALEAAHITSYLGPESNRVTNGLLLRADIHTLLDLNLIGIDPRSFRLVATEQLQKTCYEELDGRELILPQNAALSPSKGALQKRWENFIAERKS